MADRVCLPQVQRGIDVARVPQGDKDSLIRDLQGQLDDEVNKNRQLEAQFKYVTEICFHEMNGIALTYLRRWVTYLRNGDG